MTATTFPTPEVISEGFREVGDHDHRQRVESLKIGERYFARTSSGAIRKFCGRCDDASGRLPWHANVYAGICFECNGVGLRPTVFADVAHAVKAERARQMAAVRAEHKRAEKHRAALDEAAAWRAAHPALAEALAPFASAEGRHPTGMLTEFADRMSHTALSDKQTAWVEQLLIEHQTATAAEQARQAAERWYGAIGEKVSIAGTAVMATTVDTQFGASRLLIVEGGPGFEGVTVKVFGSGQTLWDVDKGDKVVLTGAVKSHEVYNSVKQTVLTRAKVAQMEVQA